MKLKERFYNSYEMIKNSIKKFPITIICIFILTLIYTVCVGNSKVDWELIGKITLFFVIFSSSTFLIETLIKEKKVNQIFYYILSAIWSAILNAFFFTTDSMFGMTNELFTHFIIRIIVCFVSSVLILGIYFNYKRTNKTFGKYLSLVVVSIFKTSLIYGILAIGIAIVTSIFVYLILNGRNYILLGKIEILLLGIYYVPAIIYAFYKQEEDVGKFAKVVLKYVLGTLVMIAFAIIYIYLLKILILWDIPSNQIFRILAALFVIGMPIWTMCDSLDEGKTFDKINKKLPYFFAPFILLQIYSIGVRIAANGMTEARYLCLMLIAFEIIYTFIYIKNKSKIGVNLLVIVAIIIISGVVPFVNMFKISALSQYSILKKYDSMDNLSKEEKSKLYGAYYYLQGSLVGKRYVENYELKNKDDGELESYKNKLDDYKYVDANINLEYISVEGYKRVYNVSASSYSLSSLVVYDSKEDKEEEENVIDKVFEKISFETNEDKEIANVNMISFVENVIEHENSIDDDFEYMNEITLDENRKIILESIYINYNEISKEVSSYNFVGYLLEK